MPVFNFSLFRLDLIPGVYSNSTSASSTYNNGGAHTVSASETGTAVSVLDDDNILEDFAGLSSPQIPETGVPSVLNSAVTLGHASGGTVTYAAGTQIHALAQVQVTNTTTGETGYAQVVGIGSSPSFSPSYLAFPFSVSEGDVLTFVPTDNVPLDGNAWYATHAYTYDQLACFCRGTMIQTADSEIPIEDLKVGDLIRTIDHGNQSIRWIGYSKHAAVGELALTCAPSILQPDVESLGLN